MKTAFGIVIIVLLALAASSIDWEPAPVQRPNSSLGNDLSKPVDLPPALLDASDPAKSAQPMDFSVQKMINGQQRSAALTQSILEALQPQDNSPAIRQKPAPASRPTANLPAAP